MSAAQQLAQFQMIALSKLGESPLNPRKHFDEAKQAELDASVAAKGVLEPLLVRPNGKVFEVVAGARRYRAAVAAKLETVPCLVRDMTDVEALEVAILENVCRADISAMDEGDAYRDLVKLGQTVEQLVEKTGRSRTIVFARMKLAELQGEARELVLSGKWSASIGELIARLPTEKAQQAAMKRLQEKAKYRVGGVESFPFREAKEILDDEFVLQLKAATFDVKDEQLVPGAGACAACPKRTHAEDNKAQFEDVKSDTCLDEVCWNKKKSASFKLLQAEAAANGKKLVKEKNLLANHYGNGPAPLTSLAAEKYSKPTDEVLGEKTWKDLLGAEVPKVVVIDGDQKTHNLVDRKAALALLEAKDPKAAAKLKEKPTENMKESWEVQRAAEQKKRDARDAALRVVRTKAIATVTKLETAVELLLHSYTRGWEWTEGLRIAGLPKGTKPGQLKPAQRVKFLLARALDRNAGDQASDPAAKLVKLDVKKLTKQALAAEPGTCFACSKPAPDKATVCVACGGEEEA
ncbi:MAG: ParB/RepB/Spo0J family partition protein [Archangium sp.]|nr:ParB/RepB/Spo0J family partition protein [Archangium sp.]